MGSLINREKVYPPLSYLKGGLCPVFEEKGGGCVRGGLCQGDLHLFPALCTHQIPTHQTNVPSK